MQQPQRFQLDVRVEVREVGPHGEWRGNNQLSVNHSMMLGTLSFLDLAAVLGRFHDLGERVQREHAARSEASVPTSCNLHAE